MAAIISRTFVLAPTTDRAVTLAGEEYLRKMTIGNNWTTIRIGAMFAFTPDGTNNLAQPAFQLGVCTADATFANTAGFSANSTTNYVGGDFFGSGNDGLANTMVYNAGGGDPYYTMANGTYGNPTCIRRRVATTSTFGIINGNSLRRMVTNTGATQRRSVVYLDITKGSPNYTLGPWNGNAISTDKSYAQFLTGFETAVPVLGADTFFQSANGTIACSEVAGNFDTISVWWNRVSFPMDLYALAVARLA